MAKGAPPDFWANSSSVAFTTGYKIYGAKSATLPANITEVAPEDVRTEVGPRGTRCSAAMAFLHLTPRFKTQMQGA